MLEPQTQVVLLDHSTTQAVYIPLNKIEPHPFNPRPYSQKYGWRVIDQNVEVLIHSIDSFGYDSSEPVLLRDMEDGTYQCIKGHTRCVAQKTRGESEILAFVRQMNEVDAAIALVTLQGSSVDSWSRRRHAYECCHSFGHGNLLNVTEYAEKINVARQTVSAWLKEYEVSLALIKSDLISEDNLRQSLSAKMASDIARLDSTDWVWFASVLLNHTWTEKNRQAAIDTVVNLSNTEFPEKHLGWIKLQTWKEAAALEAGDTGNTNAIGLLNECVACVNVALLNMDEHRPVWIFNKNNEPKLEHWNLQKHFLERLATLNSISPFQIQQQESYLYAEIQELDTSYKAFIKEHETQQQLKLHQEAERQRLLILQQKYCPEATKNVMGIPVEIKLDAVFINPSSLNYKFTDEQLILEATENLKDTGYVITFIPDGLSLFQWQSALEYTGCLKFLELLTWVKPGSAHLHSDGRYVNNVVFVHVGVPTNSTTHYFNALNTHLKTSIGFPDVIETEKLKWSKNQIPIDLATYLLNLYTPPDATIFDCATACGTFSACSKFMKRKAFWYTNKEALFTRISERLNNSPFHESLQITQ